MGALIEWGLKRDAAPSQYGFCGFAPTKLLKYDIQFCRFWYSLTAIKNLVQADECIWGGDSYPQKYKFCANPKGGHGDKWQGSNHPKLPDGLAIDVNISTCTFSTTLKRINDDVKQRTTTNKCSHNSMRWQENTSRVIGSHHNSCSVQWYSRTVENIGYYNTIFNTITTT